MEQGKIGIINVDKVIKNRIEPVFLKLGYKNTFFTTDLETSQAILKKLNFDLILCRINPDRKEENADIQTALSNTNVSVIYIIDKGTAHLFEKESLNNFYSFLIQPFNSLTFRSIIEIYFRTLKGNREKNSIEVRKEDEKSEIRFENIYWIKSEGNYCFFYTRNGLYSLRITMKKMLDILPVERFIQVHRSYIIQIGGIEGLSFKDKTVLIHDEVIPLGRKYKKGLLSKMNII